MQACGRRTSAFAPPWPWCLPAGLPAGLPMLRRLSPKESFPRLAVPPATHPTPTHTRQVGVGIKVYRHPAGAFGQRQLIATVKHSRPLAPAWIHDFPATATHAVLPQMPLYFNVRAWVAARAWRPLALSCVG